MADIMLSPEQFSGDICLISINDLPYIKPILETWVRDRSSGEPLPKEVDGNLQDMRDSIEGKNDYKYLVARTESGEVIGVMGLKKVEGVMRYFTLTDNPGELINAYVSAGHRDGKGVGRALVNGIILLARALGYKEIVLNSGPRYMTTAWGFYDKVFGPRVDVAIGMYGYGGDAPIWRMVL
ncbi:MAG: GNAT family N-acetyltransferase [Candidatus Dojkabacteria bacterium]